MNTVDDDPERLDPLQREALGWIIRLKSGEATPSDAAAFERWRAPGPDRDAALREAMRLWRLLGTAAVASAAAVPQPETVIASASAPSGSAPTIPRHAVRAKPRGVIGRRAMLAGSLAASAAAVGWLAADPPLGLWPSLGELTADYRTDKGERRTIALGDDVSVTLNTRSSLSVGASRRLVLVGGEALVRCGPGSAREPLSIEAGHGRVAAGTAEFSIRLDGANTTVLCLSGTVVVHHGLGSVSLAKSQRTDYSGTSLGTPGRADPDIAASWANGLLIFKDRPLAEVIDEVNRYRPGRIVLTSAALGRRLVNGAFHIDRLDGILAQIRDLFGARVNELPGGLVLVG